MFERGPIRWSPGETPNPQWARAKAKHIDGNANAGDQHATATLLPKGADRGIVLVRGFIGEGTPLTNAIGEHRKWSTDPEAGAKATFAWDTATGQVGVYVEHSCIQGTGWCRDAKPLVRTQHARVVDDSTAPTNEYWVEPYGDGGIRIDVSMVNAFVDAPLVETQNLGRINATFYVWPHGYDDKNRNFTGFDSKTQKDKFPSWEVLRYPRLKENSGGLEALWQATVWQGATSDLKAPQHTCTRIGPDTAPVDMSCA
ncbi:hypothetical protein [Streptomyces sp. NBC_01408]|uniref:hypothetical protein n=1 Tax=Streptomyces sp. NBC_01408 TaxID=2903855 RepID=UPI0022587CE3|nr:hypothetical protein [Streptomyces sp. NBC_01408]MCX4695501.1 hypothetical protein [Streptomyces sp. NBC_01408]